MAVAAAEAPRLRRQYQEQVVPELVREFRYTNAMQVPRLEKIVVNIGLGEAIQNGRAIDAAVADVKTMTGQAPIVIRARKSVAAFKLRAGMPIGVKVTLRADLNLSRHPADRDVRDDAADQNTGADAGRFPRAPATQLRP